MTSEQDKKRTRRGALPKEAETFILTTSRRRCCLCFGIRHDYREKQGQIAHLDQNPNNNTLENLAWLCFEHHDLYDSKTRQSKGLTIGEVKFYREQLYTTNRSIEQQIIAKYMEQLPLLSYIPEEISFRFSELNSHVRKIALVHFDSMIGKILKISLIKEFNSQVTVDIHEDSEHLPQALSDHYDLILLYPILPVNHPGSLIKHIQSTSSNTKFICVTPETDLDFIKMLHIWRTDDIIAMPFAIEIFILVVRKQLKLWLD